MILIILFDIAVNNIKYLIKYSQSPCAPVEIFVYYTRVLPCPLPIAQLR